MVIVEFPEPKSLLATVFLMHNSKTIQGVPLDIPHVQLVYTLKLMDVEGMALGCICYMHI